MKIIYGLSIRITADQLASIAGVAPDIYVGPIRHVPGSDQFVLDFVAQEPFALNGWDAPKTQQGQTPCIINLADVIAGKEKISPDGE